MIAGQQQYQLLGNVGREDREARYRRIWAGGIREGREEKVGADKFTLQSLVFVIYKRGLQGGSQE